MLNHSSDLTVLHGNISRITQNCKLLQILDFFFLLLLHEYKFLVVWSFHQRIFNFHCTQSWIRMTLCSSRATKKEKKQKVKSRVWHLHCRESSHSPSPSFLQQYRPDESCGPFSADNYLLIAVLFLFFSTLAFFFFFHTLLNLSVTKGQSAPTAVPLLHLWVRRTDLTDQTESCRSCSLCLSFAMVTGSQVECIAVRQRPEEENGEKIKGNGYDRQRGTTDSWRICRLVRVEGVLFLSW